jgi:hypothetical protein
VTVADKKAADTGVITFGGHGLDSESESIYREKIRQAKGGVNALKGASPLGEVERPAMPDFDAVQRMPRASSQNQPNPQSGGVQPRPAGSPVLTSETREQLAQLGNAMSQPQVEEEIKKEVQDNKEELFDAFDFMAQGEAERILNNKKRRKEIEERCEPMKLEDLILKDEVAQTVPIVPGKFEATFRTLNPEESLFIKQLLAKETAPSESYALEKFSLCQLACAIVSLNGADFPDHRKPDGTPDEELFKVKLKKLMKKSGYVIADLGLNYIWFDIRVRKLLSPDKLGNG